MSTSDKWYQVIRCSNTVKNPFVADFADLKGIDEWDLTRGIRMNNWDPSIVFQARKSHNNGDPDDVLQNVLGMPIYSSSVRQAFEKASIGGIQYLPVHILRPDNGEIEGFSIANILNLIPCLDWAHSIYRKWEGRPGVIRSYTRLVVSRSLLEGFDIVRMYEFKLNIYVSERVRNIFEQNKFSGYEFDPLTLSD